MDPERDNLTRAWLRKASHDLDSARLLGSASPPLRDTAIYHCQQAAEKAIKGYLFHWCIEPPKTHDVARLIRKAAEVEAVFLTWEEASERLTYYATAFRYPESEETDPDAEDLAEAIVDAEVLLRQVLRLLPKRLHPDPQGEGEGDADPARS